ncbi:MAG: hypothetical protein ABIJ04_08140 [Bacteroidota bacterium]
MLIGCLITIATVAQIRIASPYSRFGIGDLADNNNAWNLSMGQTSYAIRSPYHINYGNPASYTAFDSLSFVFEGGFNADIVQLSSNLQTVTRNYASLGYVLFGIPVTKWWRMSLGLVPYSDVGYNVVNLESYEGIGQVARIYRGSGGINRFYWGNGFKLWKSFSIGFNFSYLFGNMEREAVVLFPDSIYYSNVKAKNNVTIDDIYFNYGIQYHGKLKNDLLFNAGAVVALESKMSAQTDYVAHTFFIGGSGIEYPKDTLDVAEGYKGKIVIPLMAGGGIGLEKPEKWLFSIDYRWANWKKFTAFDLADSLVDSQQISAGAEFLPDINSYNNYFKRVRYRVGFIYNNTYLKLRGKQLNEFAVTVGFGLPLRGVKTALNISAQAGIRGTTEADLIRETYLRFIIGFSIYERWFIKRKYY